MKKFCTECRNRGMDPNHWGGDCPLREGGPVPQTAVAMVTIASEPRNPFRLPEAKKSLPSKPRHETVALHETGTLPHCPTCKCAGPKTVAERVRAFRERKRAEGGRKKKKKK